MKIDNSCVQAAGQPASGPILTLGSRASGGSVHRTKSGARWVPLLVLCAAGLLTACTTGPIPPGQQAAVQAPSTPKPPLEALPFDEAVASLATSLFGRAEMDQSARRTLVVDPLIDRATGNQSAATRAMEAGMLGVARERFPQWEPRPFTAAEVERKPLLLVGSITSVDAAGVIPPRTGRGEPSTYRIWAVLADLETGKVVAHETAWVRPEGVNVTPTRFFQDSPAWAADPHKAAYIRTCALDPGAAVDPVYMRGLTAATYAATAVKAYESGRYREALNSYEAARRLPSGDDELRVLNGLYLTNAALGRTRPAEQAFAQLVDAGLSRGKLSVKFVFRPASTRFWPDRTVSGSYPMWLRQIAQRTAEQPNCLRVVGHTSPTGSVAANDTLSERRAQTVRAQLIRRATPLSERTAAVGRGSQDVLVGNGRDDATDVLDRRVEFEPHSCQTLRAGLTGATSVN